MNVLGYRHITAQHVGDGDSPPTISGGLSVRTRACKETHRGGDTDGGDTSHGAACLRPLGKVMKESGLKRGMTWVANSSNDPPSNSDGR
jgi:hypothetical protein